MSEWRQHKLGEIATVIDSLHKTPSYIENGFSMVRVTDIKGGFLKLKNTLKVSKDVFEDFSKKHKATKGDIVMSRVGTYGVTCLVKDEVNFCLGQNTLFLISRENPEFLFYYLNSDFAKSQIESLATGSTQKTISLKSIKDIPISIPDLTTQVAIAEILLSLDDKIELNNKINQELESLAQTLFKQWFIDFEFPNENGEPYKSSGGELVDSELGEIPKGWEVKKLDDISNITIGRTPPRKEHQWFSIDDIDYKWISIRDMGNCGTYIYSTSEYLTEEAVIKFKVPVIDINTVILSFKLTVGRVSITTERMVSNEAIAHLNLKGTVIFPEFLYLYLKQFNFDTLGSTSSIATAVNSKSIKSIPLISPNEEVLIKFKELVLSIFSRINNLTFENRDLTNLRDTLLPKLISGELEINEISI
jgi:type I restriction enzyme S subunit